MTRRAQGTDAQQTEAEEDRVDDGLMNRSKVLHRQDTKDDADDDQ